MWNQFLLENIHFAINLFAALVFFAVFWLYFDSWVERKEGREIPKLAGLALISLSYLVHAASLETTILEISLLGSATHLQLLALTRLSGYSLLIAGVAAEQLQKHPTVEGLSLARALFPISFFPLTLVNGIYPAMAGAVGILYLRRATLGFERHLKPIAYAFFTLSLSELLALSGLFENLVNVDLFRLVAPFGPLWIIGHAALLVGVLILGRWSWQYLLRRLQPQLFMIFTGSVLTIFLLTSLTFTWLLVRNLQDESLRRLDTDVKVLSFAIESKKAEVLSDAQVIAQQGRVGDAVKAVDRLILADISQNFFLTKDQSFLAIVDANGMVLARGEDRERIGDSLSGDPLVRRALTGETVATTTIKDGVLAPDVSIRAVAPIKDSEAQVIGSVLAGYSVDNAFVDGIKEATGLEAAVYGENTLSATTLQSADGKSRWVGTKEVDEKVLAAVLARGESFTGEVEIGNTPYFAAYLPLTDVDNAPIGMLFVGEPQANVLITAGLAIEFTFVITALLLILSIAPAYLVSRHIVNQLR